MPRVASRRKTQGILKRIPPRQTAPLEPTPHPLFSAVHPSRPIRLPRASCSIPHILRVARYRPAPFRTLLALSATLERSLLYSAPLERSLLYSAPLERPLLYSSLSERLLLSSRRVEQQIPSIRHVADPCVESSTPEQAICNPTKSHYGRSPQRLLYSRHLEQEMPNFSRIEQPGKRKHPK